MKNLLSTQERLKSGNSSFTDIVDSYIQTIEKNNSSVNAFVSTDTDAAKKQALEIEKKLKKGTAGSLAGTVIGVKGCTL